MPNRGRRVFSAALCGLILATGSAVATPRPSAAVEEGAAAPDFKLPSTTGLDIVLSDYKGKKWVLLEFYGADFSPV